MEHVRLKLNSKIVMDNLMYADGFLNRLVGLMFKKSLLPGTGLFITRCNSVHTFFVFFNLDIVFVNSNLRVIKTLEALKPWRITNPFFKASSVLELPQGAIKKMNISVGDAIDLEFV